MYNYYNGIIEDCYMTCNYYAESNNDITEDYYMICNYYTESNSIFIEDDGLHNNRDHISTYNRMYSNPSLVQPRVYRHQNR